MLTHPTGAHGKAPAGDAPPPTSMSEKPAPIDLNAVVAYNVRAIRLLRGLTQEHVAERLARFTGHRLPQASISQMERAFYGERRRLFNAHDLYLLSKVFDVPVVYFFLPPPTCLDHPVANTGEPVSALLDGVFGTPSSLGAVDRRLIEIANRSPEPGSPRERAHEDAVRCLHVSRLSEIDCNARLREIGNLLQELTDRHYSDDRVAPPSRAHP